MNKPTIPQEDLLKLLDVVGAKMHDDPTGRVFISCAEEIRYLNQRISELEKEIDRVIEVADRNSEACNKYSGDIEELKKEVSDLHDKLYHESRKAPEVEYLLNQKIEKLEWQLSQFKIHGTDACENYDCKDGRITIFKTNKFCISCDPKGYYTYEKSLGERINYE